MRWIKVQDDAILPERKTENAAGYDVYANEDVLINPNSVAIVKTGISFEDLPADMYIQLQLRSSIALMRPLLLANGVGIVDSDYTGHEIGIMLFNRSMSVPCVVDKNERLAQAIILKYHTTDDEHTVTTKRKGGYGSTGK